MTLYKKNFKGGPGLEGHRIPLGYLIDDSDVNSDHRVYAIYSMFPEDDIIGARQQVSQSVRISPPAEGTTVGFMNSCRWHVWVTPWGVWDTAGRWAG